MSTPVLTFFNNKGGVGKTALVYHLAWMFAEQGVRVLAVDLDPQANLTAAFLDEDQLADLWSDDAGVSTIFKSVKPLLDVGDFAPVGLSDHRCEPGIDTGRSGAVRLRGRIVRDVDRRAGRQEQDQAISNPDSVLAWQRRSPPSASRQT